MSGHYTIHKGQCVLLEPRYYGSIDYYACMAAYEHVYVDYGARFDKRHKLTHRTTIADVNGKLSLTMPLSRETSVDGDGRGYLTWGDMRVSAHDQWWNIHRVALESAYGRTPFFEFYIDRFLPVLNGSVLDEFPTLEAVDRHIDGVIRGILGIDADVAEVPAGVEVVDMRRSVPSVISEWKPYYQVRRDRLGFISGLSVLDLLFNMGPEGCLWLKHSIEHSVNGRIK